MNTPPVSQREVVSVYTANHFEGEFDVYILFKSGAVMYTECCDSVIDALNSSAYEWAPSHRGEQYVRDVSEFIGYFPAPCKEQI